MLGLSGCTVTAWSTGATSNGWNVLKRVDWFIFPLVTSCRFRVGGGALFGGS